MRRTWLGRALTIRAPRCWPSKNWHHHGPRLLLPATPGPALLISATKQNEKIRPCRQINVVIVCQQKDTQLTSWVPSPSAWKVFLLFTPLFPAPLASLYMLHVGFSGVGENHVWTLTVDGCAIQSISKATNVQVLTADLRIYIYDTFHVLLLFQTQRDAAQGAMAQVKCALVKI